MAISLLFIIISYNNSYLIGLFIVMYLFSFGFGHGPIWFKINSWVYLVEMLPPIGLAICVIIHWIFVLFICILAQISYLTNLNTNIAFEIIFLLVCLSVT